MYLTRTVPPARYRELSRFLPQVSDRARALGISPKLVRAVDAQREHSSRALPAARVNLVFATLRALEGKLGSAQAAGAFLLDGDRAAQLRRHGSTDTRAGILASA